MIYKLSIGFVTSTLEMAGFVNYVENSVLIPVQALECIGLEIKIKTSEIFHSDALIVL